MISTLVTTLTITVNNSDTNNDTNDNNNNNNYRTGEPHVSTRALLVLTSAVFFCARKVRTGNPEVFRASDWHHHAGL